MIDTLSVGHRTSYGTRMRRVIYTSVSLVGTDPAALEAILSVSADRNGRTGITGMLWSDGEHFAQVLEGEPDFVGATMDRILADHRHRDIDIVLDRSVRVRLFGQWSMVLADGREECTAGTIFLTGYALGARGASAKRLYDVVSASEAKLDMQQVFQPGGSPDQKG